MTDFLGYILVERGVVEWWPGEEPEVELYPYRGLQVMRRWPLDDWSGHDSMAHDMMMERWDSCDSPEQVDSATKNVDYLYRYAKECERRGIWLDICALGVDESMSFPKLGCQFTFCGYDCMAGEHGLSYNWADGLIKEECLLFGWKVNQYGLFTARKACQEYGDWRRSHLLQGENWEDCGLEVTVGLARAPLDEACLRRWESCDRYIGEP